MKIAIVVQRYGTEINGGAELHARYVAERLSRHATVEVLTTCAKDYLTWKNEWPSGEETVNGIRVRRFPVTRPRNTDDFGRRSALSEAKLVDPRGKLVAHATSTLMLFPPEDPHGRPMHDLPAQ